MDSNENKFYSIINNLKQYSSDDSVILKQFKELMKNASKVHLFENELKKNIENKDLHEGTIRYRKGYISNIIKINKYNLIDREGLLMLDKVTTIRQIQKIATKMKKEKLFLSDAITLTLGKNKNKFKINNSLWQHDFITFDDLLNFTLEEKQSFYSDMQNSLYKLSKNISKVDLEKVVYIQNCLKELNYF